MPFPSTDPFRVRTLPFAAALLTTHGLTPQTHQRHTPRCDTINGIPLRIWAAAVAVRTGKWPISGGVTMGFRTRTICPPFFKPMWTFLPARWLMDCPMEPWYRRRCD